MGVFKIKKGSFFIMEMNVMGSIIYYISPEEQDTFCSEALDESASILNKVWVILFERTREKKSVHYE